MVSLGQLSHAQLNTSIERIAARAQGKVVGVSCSLPGTPIACDLNAAARLPMQSVYKLPIAMTVLHEVDEGRLSLSQKARFLPGDVISPRQYSPLRDAHPNGGVDVAIKELLRLTVEESDALLRLLSDGSPLSPANTELLLRWMTETPTGEHRIPGSLPNDVTVAHKTGTSGEDRGVTHATNDVGLITLPGGKMLALAILIEDSPESEDVREGVIAEIARAIWAQAVNATAQKEEHGSNARAAVMRAHVQ